MSVSATTSDTSFDLVEQIDAGLLNVGYVEAGPGDGSAVVVDDATFDRSAASFDNPDHVDIAIHNYRWRLGLAEGEAEYDELEKRLADGIGHIPQEAPATFADAVLEVDGVRK